MFSNDCCWMKIEKLTIKGKLGEYRRTYHTDLCEKEVMAVLQDQKTMGSADNYAAILAYNNVIVGQTLLQCILFFAYRLCSTNRFSAVDFAV